MPSSNAARQMDDFFDPEESFDAQVPASEQAPYQPRFRVVVRRAAMATARNASSGSLHFPMALVAIPVLCLLVYIMFGTLAMRGGFYKGQLSQQLQHERIVRNELEAQLNQKRAPAIIAQKAKAIGMSIPKERVFAGSKTGRSSDR